MAKSDWGKVIIQILICVIILSSFLVHKREYQKAMQSKKYGWLTGEDAVKAAESANRLFRAAIIVFLIFWLIGWLVIFFC